MLGAVAAAADFVRADFFAHYFQDVAVSGQSTQPPDLQWLRSTPVIGPLGNLLLWAVPAAGVLGLAGVVLATRDRRPPAVLAAVVVVVVLGWFSTRYAHPLRYLLPAVPALCALAVPLTWPLRRPADSASGAP